MSTTAEKITELNLQAWELAKKDGPRAYRMAKKVQGLLSKCAGAQPIDEFKCLKTQAYCLDMESKPGEALPIGLKANQLAERIGDKYLIGSIQSILGRIYWHIDDFPTAMDYYLNALKLAQTEHHTDLEISLINGMGMVQYELENYPEALGYFKTCLEKADENNPTGQADANNNIAYVLHLLGRDQEAIAFAEAALTLFNQIRSYVGKLHTLHTLGAIHLALGNDDQAMVYLQEGLALAQANNSRLLELTYIVEISRIHQKQGRLDQAEGELLLALKNAEKISSITNISKINERLAEIYKETQNYRSALIYFEAFHATYKKIFNDKSDRRIKNLEILHQVELTRKQAEIYHELARTDSLTGLVNRRGLLEIAEVAVQQARISQRRLAAIMLDIDHFKNVNDQYGHQIGDEVLAAVATGIKESLRQGDIAGRYGGEEFIVLVLDATPEQCFKISERIRQSVARQSVQTDQATIKVTISLGLASVISDQAITLEELINRADQAMYKAKEQGRNCVVALT